MEQLLLGIRYVDIRVIYLEKTDEYWTGHGGIRIQKLDDVISQVMEFVSQTRKEIVIFDIHEIISGKSTFKQVSDLFFKVGWMIITYGV